MSDNAFMKFFKLKQENARKIKTLIKVNDSIVLKDILFRKANGSLINEPENISISFVDEKVLAVAINKTLGVSDELIRYSQSLVSRLINLAASYSYSFLPENQDLEGNKEVSDPAGQKSPEDILLEMAKQSQEVSKQSDALSSDCKEELPEKLDLAVKKTGTGDKKIGSSQSYQSGSENSSESDEPVATCEVDTKRKLKEIKQKLSSLRDFFDKEDYERVKNEFEKLKRSISNQSKTKTLKKLISKIEKLIDRIDTEYLKPIEVKKEEKIPLREFNLPYCFVPNSSFTFANLHNEYKNHINNENSKKIKKLFKKFLDEIGFEESQRIDKKKVILNLAKYKNPYNAYKQEVEKSYLLLMLDMSGSMTSFYDLIYPVFAVSKEHENIIVILHANTAPFAVIRNGKVAMVEVELKEVENFYKELIKNYNISNIISVSDWDGVETYKLLMEKTNAKWIWLDPYCCNVYNYIPRKEKTGKHLPNEIKPFKDKIVYYYAVGNIDGFIAVLEKET